MFFRFLLHFHLLETSSSKEYKVVCVRRLIWSSNQQKIRMPDWWLGVPLGHSTISSDGIGILQNLGCHVGVKEAAWMMSQGLALPWSSSICVSWVWPDLCRGKNTSHHIDGFKSPSTTCLLWKLEWTMSLLGTMIYSSGKWVLIFTWWDVKVMEGQGEPTTSF